MSISMVPLVATSVDAYDVSFEAPIVLITSGVDSLIDKIERINLDLPEETIIKYYPEVLLSTIQHIGIKYVYEKQEDYFRLFWKIHNLAYKALEKGYYALFYRIFCDESGYIPDDCIRTYCQLLSQDYTYEEIDSYRLMLEKGCNLEEEAYSALFQRLYAIYIKIMGSQGYKYNSGRCSCCCIS